MANLLQIISGEDAPVEATPAGKPTQESYDNPVGDPRIGDWMVQIGQDRPVILVCSFAKTPVLQGYLKALSGPSQSMKAPTGDLQS